MTTWTTRDIPSQRGRTALVTGTGGIGFEVARALAHAGGDVIIAGRNPQKGAEAVARIREEASLARVRFEQVDLASLQSVEALAARLSSQTIRLDLLINNAAVMTPRTRMETRDGFELQFGTNYLGHFALTAHLLPLLRRGNAARVVTLSSVAARGAQIDFKDLQASRDYRPMPVYGQSKLACLMFAFELQRRSTANGWGIASLAAHPGISRTGLVLNSPGGASPLATLTHPLRLLFQTPSQGALPVLYAAASPDARGGWYFGPDRMGETRGHPAPARIPPQASDPVTAARLWDVSEALTGVSFQTLTAAMPQPVPLS